MSRSRRQLDPTAGVDPWAIVDAWAADAVDPVVLRARWSGRAVPVRGVDAHVDVVDVAAARDALRRAGLRRRGIRPARRALGRTGEAAFAPDPEVIEALRADDVSHRVVTLARRYVWRGTFAGRTFCEVSTATDGTMTIDAWYEPVWIDGLRRRPDVTAGASKHPPNALRARAAINDLLGRLGVEPINTGRDGRG